MAFPDSSSRRNNNLIPSFLYGSSSPKTLPLNQILSSSAASSTAAAAPSKLMIPAPNEKIEMYSPAFYAACTVGGILSCGLTHMTVTPLDLVKCNMQVYSCSLSISLNSIPICTLLLRFNAFLSVFAF